MSAKVIELYPSRRPALEMSGFRKALIAIRLMLKYKTVEEAQAVIQAWVREGIIIQDDADALYEFYNWRVEG